MQKTAKLWCGTPPGEHPLGDAREPPPGHVPEAVLHRVPDRAGAHQVQPRAADPVGLDHPPVQRIGHAGGPGDQLQIGPRPGELPRHRPQARRRRPRRRRTRTGRRNRPARRTRASSAGTHTARTGPVPERSRPPSVLRAPGPSAPARSSPAPRPRRRSAPRRSPCGSAPTDPGPALRRAGRCSPCARRPPPRRARAGRRTPAPSRPPDRGSRDTSQRTSAGCRPAMQSHTTRTASATAAATRGVRPIPSPVSAT